MARLTSTFFFGTAIVVSLGLMLARRLDIRPDLIPAWSPTFIVLASHVASLSLYLTYRAWIYPLLLDPTRHIPGPIFGWPIVGYVFEQFKRPPSLQFLDWMDSISNPGMIRYPTVTGNYRFMPTSPKLLSELLVTKSYDFQKPVTRRNILRLALGDGLIVVEGDVHRFQRKNLQPSFAFRHIKSLYPLMLSKSLELCKCVRQDMQNSKYNMQTVGLEINQWASRATLDIIGVAAIGYEFNTLHNNEDELAQLYEWMFQPNTKRMVFFALSLVLPQGLIASLPTKLASEVEHASSTLRRICKKLVQDKKESVKKESTQSVDTLAHLIRSDNFSDDELMDQVLTFLAAGHETTSSAFTWVLYALAKRPEVQSRLREEIRSNVNFQDLQRPDAEDTLAPIFESLPYLNGVCNETLRLWPSVPATLRTAIRDTQIGDFKIAKGSEFIVPIWSLNRAPHLWGPQASEFMPERWIDVDSGKANNHGGVGSNYAFLTFLHGPRSCIGQGFAKAELRALVATFVNEFEFSLARPNEEVVPFGLVTVKPKHGLYLKIKPVDEASTKI